VKKAERAAGAGGKVAVDFTLTPPETSSVREADFTITLQDSAGKRRGELYFRSVISGEP
jgi:hypothetical protein